MAIGRTFEESILKAVRSLEAGLYHLELNDEFEDEKIEKGFGKQEMSGYFISVRH